MIGNHHSRVLRYGEHAMLLFLLLFSLSKRASVNSKNQFNQIHNNSHIQISDQNRCIYQQIPFVSSPLDTAQHLLLTNKSFIRFGDGDTSLLMGIKTYYQNKDAELIHSMRTIISSNLPSLMIGLPDIFNDCYSISLRASSYYNSRPYYRDYLQKTVNLSQQYFSTMISSIYVHSQQTHCHNLDMIYGTLRKVWMNKDVVIVRGNNTQIYQFDVYDTAKSQKIYYAPRSNGWSAYPVLKETLLNEDDNKLFILTCGPEQQTHGLMASPCILDMLELRSHPTTSR